MPTPCSPVQVPSIASARSTRRWLNRLRFLDLFRASRVDQDHEVEVAVADVAEQRHRQRCSSSRPPWSRSRTRRGARSARRRRSTPRATRAGSAGRRSRRRGAPARAGCAPRAWSPRRSPCRRAPARSPAPLSACSTTAAALSVELEKERGRYAVAVFLRLLIAATVLSRTMSLRAIGMPAWMVWITVLPQPSIRSKAHTAADIASCTG